MFELFMGCLGNGTTVCNKAVMKNGDYKKIAHISNGGNIQFFVAESYIPVDAMEKIKAVASRDKEKFRSSFECLQMYQQYGKILDAAPLQKLLEFTADKRPLEEKLPAMREYYYSIS